MVTVAARTGQQLVDAVTSVVDDTSLLATLVLGWINEGLGSLAAVLRIEELVTIAVTPPTLEYTMPTATGEMIEIFRVVLVSAPQTKLVRLSLDDFDDPPASLGGRIGYRVWAGKLKLTSLLAADTVNIYRYRSPAAITLASSPEVPPFFDSVLVHYGAKIAYERDEQTDAAALATADFERVCVKIDTYTSRRAQLNRSASAQYKRRV